MKTSIITQINSVKEWKGPHGITYFYDMVLENGDKVNMGKKTNTAFQLGTQLEYVIESTNEYGVHKIRHPKDEEKTTTSTVAVTAGPGVTASNSAGTKQIPQNMIGFAMSYSKDLVVSGKMDITGLEATAELIYNWMASKI